MEKIIVLDDSLEDYDLVIGLLQILFPECPVQFSPRYSRSQQSAKPFPIESSFFSVTDKAL